MRLKARQRGPGRVVGSDRGPQHASDNALAGSSRPDKQEHLLDRGIRWIKVEREEADNDADRPSLSFNLRVCRHCDDPACLAVCPSEAIMKRSDGVVLIDEGHEAGAAAKVHEFGTLSFISYWHKRNDGMLGITLTGKQRFRVLATDVKLNQLTVADIELLPHRIPHA